MKLICVFVFAYAKSRFSHDEAHIASCNSNSNTDKVRTPYIYSSASPVNQMEVINFANGANLVPFLCRIVFFPKSWHGSSVGSDAALDASFTEIDPCIWHILS